jgi:hypothetical protein
MNHFPRRPEMAEYDEMVIPPSDDQRDGTGAALLAMFGLGLTVAAGFIWAFIEVGL